MEANIVPKCLPKGPSDAFWTHLGQPLGASGALLGAPGAPGTLFGGPRELCGAPRELFGSSGESFWNSRGRFWKHFGVIFETFFFPCCACRGSQHLALLWSFLGRSGAHRSQIGRDRSRRVNTNESATFYLTVLSRSSSLFSVELWPNCVGTGSNYR